MDRNSLRKKKLAARDQMPLELRQQKSKLLLDLLRTHPFITSANHIFSYIHFRSEVQTLNFIRQLIAAGKTVSVPVTLPEECRLLAVQLTNPDTQIEPGCYGIAEPTPSRIAEATMNPATIDTAVIPGSVFDLCGGRLGYGGGYYDRFLTKESPRAIRVGIAFEIQLVDQVPMEPHDQYVDILITEKQIYDCKRNRHEKDSCL